MSRRNTRQGKSRRRAERDRRQVTERERKRPGIPGQEPRTVEEQAVQAVQRPDGSGPRDSDEHGSGLPSEADDSLIAVNPDEADLGTDADLENADPGDFGDLDPDDADLVKKAVMALEAAEAWAKARMEPRDSWAPSQQQHRLEDAEEAFFTALAVPDKP